MSAADTAKTTPRARRCVHSGALAAYNEKCADILEYSEHLEHNVLKLFDSQAAGLLNTPAGVPKPAAKSRERCRLSDLPWLYNHAGCAEGRIGSARRRGDCGGRSRAKEDEAGRSEARGSRGLGGLGDRRLPAVRRGSGGAGGREGMQACADKPGPWATRRYCATCCVAKKGWCKVRACVAARKPLLLTLTEPAPEEWLLWIRDDSCK